MQSLVDFKMNIYYYTVHLKCCDAWISLQYLKLLILVYNAIYNCITLNGIYILVAI